MKRLLGILLITLVALPAFAINVNDIDTLIVGAQKIVASANDLQTFCLKLGLLRDAGFQIEVLGSTQTVTISNPQKQGLLAQYQNLKQKLQDDLNTLP